MADESSGLDSVLKGLLGFTGGVLQRNLVGNILMSGLRGGVLGSRSGEAMPEDPNSGVGAYLGALTGLPSDKGWASASLPAPKANVGGGMYNPAAWLPAFMQNPMLMQAGMSGAAPARQNPFGMSPDKGGDVFAKPVNPFASPTDVLSDPEVLRKLGWLKRS